MTGLVISKLTAVLLLVSILTLSVLLLLQFPSLATAAHAASATIDNPIKMTKQQSFIDSHGRLNIIGVVNNNGNVPIAVTVGLDTIHSNGKSGITTAATTAMMTDPTYGNIIYPFT